MDGYLSVKEKLCAEIKTVPALFQKKHLPSLDGFRAFSVFYIIAFHWYLGWHNSDGKGIHIPDCMLWVLKEGILGVHFFFVLSGFLITTLLIKRRSGTRKYLSKTFISDGLFAFCLSPFCTCSLLCC